MATIDNLPLLMKTFLNFFWVNLPKEWTIEYDYKEPFLNIKIILEINSDDEEITYISRKYSYDIIKKIDTEIDELAQECTNEVISIAKKINDF